MLARKNELISPRQSRRVAVHCRSLALGTAMALVAPFALAELAVVGSLTNFDAANFEGETAYGMQIELENIQPAEFGMAWPSKYGQPAYVANATGTATLVKYQSTWDPAAQQFIARTVPHPPGTGFQGTCYSFSATDNAGCDHFGPRPTTYNYRVISYRWLLEDPLHPGQLIPSLNNIFVPTPVYTFVPPVVAAAQPVLVAEVDAPETAEPRYGDATWMKVFVNEIQRHVTLEELVDTNTVVPQNATQIETDWTLVQPTPPGAGHRQRGKHVNQHEPAPGTRAVIRRYETYAYTGAYDPVTHEAVCGGDGSCNVPQDGELGDMLVAQMAAANIAVPTLTISMVGSGKVSSSDGVLSCGSKCVATYANNTVVTLTAQPASNNVFTGWSGACSGAQSTCNVTVNDELTATANFAAVVKTGGGGGGGSTSTTYTLSVGRSNTGTVTATPAGTDRMLNCGSACSAKFASGTVVTLTATPPSGKSFLGWSGACSGASLGCTVTMTKDLSASASFSK